MALANPNTQPQFYANVAQKRLFAWVLDTVLIALICVVILPFTAFLAVFFFLGLIAVVGFVYRVVTLANGSATPGMRIMAIEFRDKNGARFDAMTALLHTLGYTISWAIPPLQIVSIILMGTSDRGQGLTDVVLGSAALNRRM